MKVPMTPENKEKCICMICHTYSQNNLKGRMFCATGKRKNTPQMKGCVCYSCPVSIEHTLSGYYYCIKGAAE
jgi:hypothetical protein